MQLEELIKVVEKNKKCSTGECPGNVQCNQCEYYVEKDKLKEMYADIQMRLKQEKWSKDKMENWDEDDDVRIKF